MSPSVFDGLYYANQSARSSGSGQEDPSSLKLSNIQLFASVLCRCERVRHDGQAPFQIMESVDQDRLLSSRLEC